MTSYDLPRVVAAHRLSQVRSSDSPPFEKVPNWCKIPHSTMVSGEFILCPFVNLVEFGVGCLLS